MSEEVALSERELEVLRHLVDGASNNEIAQRLGISPNTVKVHVRNTYAKLGVLSRAEAVATALRRGLVAFEQPASSEPEPDQALEIGAQRFIEEEKLEPAITPSAEHNEQRAAPTMPPTHIAIPRSVAFAALALLVVLIGLVAVVLVRQTPESGGTPQPLAAPGWERLTPLPDATADAAALFSDETIFLIGGEDETQVLGATRSFSPRRGVWALLAEKPTPVADASAAAIGDQILVPGGRTADGQPATIFEAYQIATNRWIELEPLPEPRAGYGIAAIDGELYVFGGRDATGPVDTTLIYNPGSATWRSGAPLPQPIADAAVASNDKQVFVIGGVTTNGQPSLATFRYRSGVWEQRAALPEPRIDGAAVVVTNRLYVIGGTPSDAPILSYLPDQWFAEELTPGSGLTGLGAVSDGLSIYILGGRSGDTPLAEHRSWRPTITVFVPLQSN